MNPRTARIDAYVSASTRRVFDELARRSGRTRAHILESAVTAYIDRNCPLLASLPTDDHRTRIDAYVLPEIRERVDRVVKDSGRSLSNVIESAVRLYLGLI